MSCFPCLAYKAPVMLAIVEVRMDFHCRVSFARVSKIVDERSSVNVKVKPRSIFMFMRDTSFIASILFTRAKFTR